MAHLEQRNFCLRVKEKFPDFFKNKKVLDIGSLDINGSNRDLFEDCNYLGLDVGEGRNVDIVSVGHLFDGPDNFFDTIISTEVFEHDMFYEETIKNVIRMLKPGGLFLFTCAAPGRPEHGTRRCGEDCAPLLIQISEQWADYYKNLDENDIRKICGFNETFPDCYFELNNIYVEIPSDLYFYGIKGGEKYLTNYSKPKFDLETFKEHIFVIDSWPDNQSKETDLINLIKRLKAYNTEILLCGHYPIKPEIQRMVDYYLFDNNNQLLLPNEFFEYGVASGRWSESSEYKIENNLDFHHDYAIWETMRNAFNYCQYLGKKYIHFLEYDNLPDEVQYRQSFLERIHQFDAVIYEYSKNSSSNKNLNPLCATFIFSIKTNIAVQLINSIKTKKEYFLNRPHGINLEVVFYGELSKLTNNIKVTDYIDNDGTLNTQAVWNRDAIKRNGAIFNCYPVVDFGKNLFLHFISGFNDFPADKDYLVEIKYGTLLKFITISKDSMFNFEIGKYKKGERIKIYYEGIEVFNQYLSLPFEEFYNLNKLVWKNYTYEPDSINLNFIDGAYLEIIDNKPYQRTFEVDFIDKKNDNVVFSSKIKNGWWTKPNFKYFVDWKIKIKTDGYDSEYTLDYNNKRVFITFESKSLGDNIAWIPYVEKFRQKHNCKVICSTFFNDLFKSQYKEIEFVEPGSEVNNIHGLYRLGLFYRNDEIDFDRHPNNPLKEPLAKIASDILGLEYSEEKAKLPKLGNKKFRRVCIAIHSTSQCKYWNNPNGWQEVVDYLKSKDYEVRLLSKEEDGFMGNKNPIGVTQQPQSKIEEILKTIQESELFIGISSGLSWLAWASGTPTILISGFTDDYLEPKEELTRIINKNVCHGCWHKHKFDPGDWKWCPEHKGSNKEFECSKSIKSDTVINQIKSIL